MAKIAVAWRETLLGYTATQLAGGPEFAVAWRETLLGYTKKLKEFRNKLSCGLAGNAARIHCPKKSLPPPISLWLGGKRCSDTLTAGELPRQGKLWLGGKRCSDTLAFTRQELTDRAVAWRETLLGYTESSVNGDYVLAVAWRETLLGYTTFAVNSFSERSCGETAFRKVVVDREALR